MQKFSLKRQRLRVRSVQHGKIAVMRALTFNRLADQLGAKCRLFILIFNKNKNRKTSIAPRGNKSFPEPVSIF